MQSDQYLEGRIQDLEELLDLHFTPCWKKVWFVIQGWPLKRLVDRPQRRFWHRWTGW